MCEKILVYPFDRHFLPILRHKFFPKSWTIDSIISPEGWGITNKDAGIIDFGNPIGIKIQSDFYGNLSTCDSMFLTQSEKKLDFESFLYPKLLEAIKMRKNIYTNFEMNEKFYIEISNRCHDSGVKFKYFSNNLENGPISIEENFIPEINTPIIFILGLIEGLNKFETQIMIHNYFLDKGYKSLLVTSRSYGSLGDAYSVPNFLFNKGILEIEKIIGFRNYIKKLEAENDPDVIIIGLPGGLIPLDKKIHNNFGITPYEISRAIQPDVSVLCTYTDNFTSEYWSYIESICKYRFSSEITGCIRYNLLMVFSGLTSLEDSKFMLFDPNVQKFSIETMKIPVIESSNSIDICDVILEKLVKNAESESF